MASRTAQRSRRESPLNTTASLDLGVIGNCSYSALVDRLGQVVWCCLPRFDGDPVFNCLLGGSVAPQKAQGVFAVGLHDFDRSEQEYEPNTAILRTRLYDRKGQSLEITDFAPRFAARDRMFRPLDLVRRIRPLTGRPRISLRVRPRFDYGAKAPTITYGSNHLRYVGPDITLRLTTNAPIVYVLNETEFLLDHPISLILGPDETLAEGAEETARNFEERTAEYWRTWSRRLALPLEWQEAVIRAAITLKLCTFEETGAIIAAMTTSIPEAPDSGRNWDYRYCWLRDAFFVIRALNSLSEVETMETYLRYLHNLVMTSDGGHLQPVFGIGLERDLSERVVNTLSGYRGMGPVRIGNQAYEHTQHDVYGNIILAATQSFFDKRLLRQPTTEDFHLFELVGERAYKVYDKPDASMWELRTRSRVHTSSSLMCWAACHRLSRIAAHLGLEERAAYWERRAARIRKTILDKAWNDKIGAFTSSFGGDDLDASVLLMAEAGFIEPNHPKFLATVHQVERQLRRGYHLFRYATPDDFGPPRTAFNICTFWYIDALARLGRVGEAREIFEALLASRNHLGLLSEDLDPATGELWGNFPQTYSMVGIINCAMQLSRKWETVL